MKGARSPLGYTIVEVMIVLMISGVMFVIAASFINGKQERTSFSEGTNNLVSQIQSIVQDVTDGHYSDVPVSCTQSGGGTTITASSSGGSGQGENPQCVFWGKLVHFYKNGTTFPETYETVSLAAARTTNPTPGEEGIPGLTTQTNIPQSLQVESMHVYDPGNTNHGNYNVGFTQSLGTVADAANGVYQSGAQTVGLVYSSALTQNTSISGNENNVTQVNIHTASSAAICLTDGLRWAVLFIGTPPGAGSGSSSNNNNQLSISVQQFGLTKPKAPLC